MSRKLATVSFAALAVIFGGCGSERLVVESDEIIVERRPDALYDQLFPAYAELCAVSQFRSKKRGSEAFRVMPSCT